MNGIGTAVRSQPKYEAIDHWAYLLHSRERILLCCWLSMLGCAAKFGENLGCWESSGVAGFSPVHKTYFFLTDPVRIQIS